MMKEDKEKSTENKASEDKPVEDQPQAQKPSEAGESDGKKSQESTEDKLKEVSAKLMSDVSSVWGQALGKAFESLKISYHDLQQI